MMDNPSSNRPARRTALLAMELSKYNVDVAALSETRLPDDGSLEETSQGYTFFWKGLAADAPRIHGVGFAIKTRLLGSIAEQPVGISERLMSWRIPLVKSRYATIFSVYAPTLVSDEDDKNRFYHALSESLSRVPTADKLVIMGDFNARVGQNYSLWSNVLGKHGVGSCNENGLRLLTLCAEHGLSITNTLFQMRDIYKKTWMHPRSKHWHLLDYVLVRQKDRGDVNVTRVMRGAELSTDHRLVISAMRLKIRPPVRKRTGKPRISVNKLLDPRTRDMFQTNVNAALNTVDAGRANDRPVLDNEWGNICDLLKDTARKTLGTETRKHRDWFNENDEEIRDLIKRKNLIHDTYLKSPTEQNRVLFSAARGEVQRKLRIMEDGWWVTYSEEMQKFFDSGDTHNFYNSLKIAYGPSDKSLAPVRAKNGDLIKDKSSILNRWAEHFSELLNHLSPTDPSFIDALPHLDVKEQLANPPTLREVTQAIASLKCRKAAGLDGVQAELLKYGGEVLTRKVHDFILECWEASYVPSQWKDSKIITIYKKKGEKAVCGNSRGISLLSVGGKVLARLMLVRLLQEIAERVLPESQCGFRQGRSTVDMVFVLRLLQEKCREQHRDLYMVFVDLSKAFDTVDRELLWKILLRFGCPAKFVAVIRSFHEGMRACVSATGEVSDPFSVVAGVKQGCVLAPVLFNLFVAAVSKVTHMDLDENMDGIPVSYRYDGGGLFNLARLKAKTRCELVTVDELQYADDAAFVSHSEAGMQHIIDSVHDAYGRSGLRMNTGKTEVMLQNTGPSPGLQVPKIKVHEQELNTVHEFTYLGSVVADDCSLTHEVQRRIGLAASAFGRLTHKVFKNHSLSLHTKKSVYQAVCVSILLFGCEAWALYRHQMRKLEAFHASCLQKILGLRWWDRVPRVEMRRRLDVTTIESMILNRQIRWAGHVIRMPEERLPRQVLYGELVEGKRSVGGQRKRYKDNLKKTIKDFHMDPKSFETDAADRAKWRQRVRVGGAAFAVNYDNEEMRRRERRHEINTDGEFVCGDCQRRLVSLSGLKSHQRAHLRRLVTAAAPEEGVVIGPDGPP